MACPVTVLCRLLIVMRLVCSSFSPLKMTSWAPLWDFRLSVIYLLEIGDCLILCLFFVLLAAMVLSNIPDNFSKHWVLHLQILSTGFLHLDVILRLLWDILYLGKFDWRSVLLGFQKWRVVNVLCPRLVCLLFLWCMLCRIYSGEALGRGTIHWYREVPM